MSKWREQFGRIGVLMGGVSSEREISLKSGHAVIEALKRQDCQIAPIDIIDDNAANILLLLRKAGIDMAFIALHGQLGEDGRIQSILEEANISYTGSGIEASRLAFKKDVSQNLLRKSNIKIPSYVTLSKEGKVDVQATISELGGFPVIVKPACEGSSIGISLIHSEEEFEGALKYALQFDSTVLVEQYIRGRELTVGILGQQALPVVEICPKHPFFNFEAKYTEGETDYIVPAKISNALAEEFQRTALEVHNVLGCEDFSRVDFMLDSDEQIYALEINTIPGFTSTSLLPKAASEIGLNFDQLVLRLLELAYGKKKEIRNTTVR